MGPRIDAVSVGGLLRQAEIEKNDFAQWSH